MYSTRCQTAAAASSAGFFSALGAEQGGGSGFGPGSGRLSISGGDNGGVGNAFAHCVMESAHSFTNLSMSRTNTDAPPTWILSGRVNLPCSIPSGTAFSLA